MHPEDEQAEPLAVSFTLEDHDTDALADARAFVVKTAGIVVVTTPALWVILTTLAAFHHIELKLDERILVCCLTGLGAVMVFAFRKKQR